jgi:CheY-like chemotaxis protein
MTIKPIDVLVGEANDGHAELAEASLQESGIVNNLYRGRDGTETLALARHTWRRRKGATDVPSLILLDCGLPRVGGVGVLRALKSDRRCSRIPVIMMTTANSREEARQCLRLGCEAYVTKWTVFLGLPGFVNSIRTLADKALWIAPHRFVAAGRHGCGPSTIDLCSISEATRAHYGRQALKGKAVCDESATP